MEVVMEGLFKESEKRVSERQSKQRAKGIEVGLRGSAKWDGPAAVRISLPAAAGKVA